MTRPTRRGYLKQATGAVTAVTLGATATTPVRAEESKRMKFAICNETFFDLKWPQEKVFRFAAECGYDAVEIAPFTINTDVQKISAAERRALRKAADAAGIKTGIRPEITILECDGGTDNGIVLDLVERNPLTVATGGVDDLKEKLFT